MLKNIRLTLAAVFFVAVTLLFLDFTGTLHRWLGWTAEVQFLPALLAMNVVVVVALVALTLFVGRVYCSVICPLGVMQDIIAWLGRRGGKKRKKRYGYSPERRWLRWGVFVAFVACLVGGVTVLSSLIAPYSSYGRIASNLFAPVYRWGNNMLAYLAERMDSYAFYTTEVWLKSTPTLTVAVATFIIIGVLAWRGGRTYCNTICPVGTLLGFLSRFSFLKIHIDETKCNRCGKCSRKCKAACIDGKHHEIDYSRCVMCMDCLETCKHGAISLKRSEKLDVTSEKRDVTSEKCEVKGEKCDNGRRTFITVATSFAASAAINAQKKKVDGGLTVIEDKVKPNRATRILPPGSFSAQHFAQHCTACQLCVSVCPNQVLRPSADLEHLMQPELSYERGYCRPECTRCSEVCPTDAIRPLTVAEKSSTRIGHAVWVRKNCLPVTDGVSCGNCARHCPSGAILMVPMDANDPESIKIPAVNTERCIGCGACENLCPVRPFSAIYVEGHERQSTY